MTVVMLLLAWLFGVATPLAIFGDRLSVFIPADTFLSLMGRLGGYNHMIAARRRFRHFRAGPGRGTWWNGLRPGDAPSMQHQF
jgi:hypothetical protein